MSEQIATVLNYIPFGRENAISRMMLCINCGLSDRQVRKAIQAAREAGELILNCQDGAGYFRSDDLDDIERQYRQDQSRAMAIMKRLKRSRRMLKDAGRLQ